MIKKYSHILLALLLLISTSGISIHKHYSNGELFSTAIFGQAKSCCETPCACCSETEDTIKVHDNYTMSSFNIDLQTPIDYFYSFIHKLLFTEKEVVIYISNNNISSPSYNCNFQILNQVFIL